MDIQSELKINAVPDASGERVILTTDGLAKAGRPELEMVGVPKELARDAAGVLNMIADYTANKKQVKAGERVGLGMSRAHLIVQLVASPTPVAQPAQKQGFFSKILGGGASSQLLRIVSAEPNPKLDEPPREAIATVILERAARSLDSENPDLAAARAELQRGVLVFPGEPARARPNPFAGANYNVENHLTWFELSQITEGAESTRYLHEALQRSPDLVAQLLGLFAEELPRMAEGELEEVAKQIIETNTAGEHVMENLSEDLGPGPVAILRSPLWIAGEDEGASRKAALLPRKYADLYFTGAGAQALSTKNVAKLAAEAVRAHASNPVALAMSLKGAHEAWFDPSAPAMPLGARWLPSMGPLSLTIAHAARAYAAGCTEEEVRASLGLGGADAARASADEKLTQQLGYEDAWKAEAMGSGLD